MKRVVLCTLLIAFSAHVVAAIPVNDIATFEASGSNFTRNYQGKKEKMVLLTSAFKLHAWTTYHNCVRSSMLMLRGTAMANSHHALVASKFLTMSHVCHRDEVHRQI